MPSDSQPAAAPEEIVFEGVHFTLRLRRPGSGLVWLILSGHDVGELGRAPFDELEKDLAAGKPLEVFIDARAVPGASVDVSREWAHWMTKNRAQIMRVHILCGSRFIQLTAKFVQQFTEFGDRMRIYTEAAAFEEALTTTCPAARAQS
jgi:hypothetical protein